MTQAALDRMVAQARTSAAITPAKLDLLSKLMREKLDTADIRTRKAYLRSVIDQVEVDDQNQRVQRQGRTGGGRPGPQCRCNKCS